MKDPITKKYSNLEKYVLELKCLIMDMVYAYAQGIHNAAEIIAEWFELNEPQPLKAWARMDTVSIKTLWGFMVNKVVIE